MVVENLKNYPNAKVYARNIENPAIRRIALAELSVISSYQSVELLSPDKFDDFLSILDKRIEGDILYTVREGMENSFNKISNQLSQAGIMSKSESKAVWSKFSFDQYKKDSFYRHSLEFRAKRANRFIKNDLKSIHSYYKDKASYGKAMQSYLNSSKAVFPTSRLIITEMSRATRKPMEVLGKSLGNHVLYYWELSALAGRKPDICDDIYSASPYTLDELPAVPHSTCMCTVSMEVDKKKIYTI